MTQESDILNTHYHYGNIIIEKHTGFYWGGTLVGHTLEQAQKYLDDFRMIMRNNRIAIENARNAIKQ